MGYSETDIFNSLPDKTMEHLRQLVNQVTGVTPIIIETTSISTSKLNPAIEPEDLLKKVSVSMPKNYPYIYFLKVTDNPDLRQIEQTFSTTKNEENSISFPRLNRQSSFFYVGSGNNIFQRFKEHLGYGSRKTYSLQLAHWAHNLNLQLDFVYARYQHDICHDVIQTLEDQLWDELLPMFGRKGKR